MDDKLLLAGAILFTVRVCQYVGGVVATTGIEGKDQAA